MLRTMNRRNIVCSTIGDVEVYPIIKPLVEILNEHDKYKYTKRCISLLQEYRKYLSVIEKTDRVYFLTLVKNDFLNRLKLSKDNGLPENIYTHMCCLVCAIYSSKILLKRLNRLQN